MTEQELKTGQAILPLIKQAEKALETLNEWIDSSKIPVGGDDYQKDNHYNLCISEFRDGSGKSLDLHRYMGNTALLEVIKAELERQLQTFRKDFDSL